MVDVHNPTFKALYLRTAREYNQKLTQNMNTLLEGSMDTALLTDIRINAHSLKGQSAVSGYPFITNLAHMIEDIARQALEEERVITTEQMHSILACLTDLSASFEEIEKADHELDLTDAEKKLKEALKN